MIKNKTRRALERWQTFIYLVLDNRLRFTVKEMAKELGISDRMVRVMINKLRIEKKALFTKNDVGYYWIERIDD